MEISSLIEKIKKLKKEKNAVILAHNYQHRDIYRVADAIGDSFGLSYEAKKTDAEIIVFCGVKFMAESAHILNPEKTVLLPVFSAGCPMADTITAEDLIEMKKKHPDAAVVSYVNTNAEIKALSDICCTSSNSIKIVNSRKEKKIIFVPDRNLAEYTSEYTNKEIISWDGFCYVHTRFNAEKTEKLRKNIPGSVIIAHPECNRDIRRIADCICSTEGMVKFVKKTEAKNIIVATETGMIERLKLESPEKNYYPAPPAPFCLNMKKTALIDVYEALKKNRYNITLPEDIRKNAEKALIKMLDVGK